MTKRGKRTSGHPARRNLPFTARAAMRDFESWMPGQSLLSEPVTVVRDLGTLFEAASAEGLDLGNPRDIDAMIDVVFETFDDDADRMLAALHDYVAFRAAGAPAEWAEERELVGFALADDGPDALAEAIEEGLEVPEGQRQVALATTRMIAGVPALLEWIGAGRAVTDTRAVRRADIAAVAEFLGIRARGAARAVDVAGIDGVRVVQTMWDLPEVSAWWEALNVCDVIEIRGTRVRRGEAADAFAGSEPPPVDVAEMIVSVCIAQLFTRTLGSEADPWHLARFDAVITEAMHVLGVDGLIEPDALAERMRPGALHCMKEIAQLGVIEQVGEEEFRVNDPLRATFGRGVSLAISFAAATLRESDPYGDEEFEEDEAGFDSPFDDPEVRAEMERRGIVHTPGLAAEMMNELAPLLAAEGYDIDNLDANDLEGFNAALARATEQHNLRLFTPVGDDRARALSVLRLTTAALAEGNDVLAGILIDAIPSDPTETMPSVAQVMGVGLGKLDEWLGDGSSEVAPAAAPGLQDARGARGAALDVLRLARRGLAFDALGQLIGRHAGQRMLRGVALAVAGAVVGLAGDEDVSVVAGRMLGE